MIILIIIALILFVLLLKLSAWAIITIVWTDDDDYALGERNQYDMDRLAIETVPSAQPEIIRCKDCKYNPNPPECGNADCVLFYGMTDQMGFCHHGERREQK